MAGLVKDLASKWEGDEGTDSAMGAILFIYIFSFSPNSW